PCLPFRAKQPGASYPEAGPAILAALGDRGDDLFAQAREAAQEVGTLGLEALDQSPVLVGAALALVEAARLQDLQLVDPRHRGRDEVAEVGVPLPLDRALRDALDDRRGVLDADLP